MNIKFIKHLIFILLIIYSSVSAQFGGDPTLLRIGFHTGNRAGILDVSRDVKDELLKISPENYTGICEFD